MYIIHQYKIRKTQKQMTNHYMINLHNSKNTVDIVNPRNKTPRIQSTKSTRSKVECMVATEKDKISSSS